MERFDEFNKSKYIQDHNDKFKNVALETKALHYGQQIDPFYGSINTPIHYSSFGVGSLDENSFYAMDTECSSGCNPTQQALSDCIASLENGKYGIVTSSGCSAISLIIHLLKHGDHVLLPNSLSGAIENLFSNVVSKVYQIEVDYINLDDLEESVKSNTKMLLIEFPTNPVLTVFDIPKISNFWKERGILLVIDSTMSTPFLVNPLLLGADIVLHSCTKYISGHSDIMMGAIVINDDELYK